MAKTTKTKSTCFYCGKDYVETNFYKSNSEFFSSTGKIPYCKQCIEKLYQQYFEKYTNDGCLSPEKKAIQRLCMIFDMYFKEDVFNSSMDKIKKDNMNISPMGQYLKTIQLSQYNKKQETYEDTIYEAEQENRAMSAIADFSDEITVEQKWVDFFGKGFSDDDYKYLIREYQDWTARHECNTKVQEENFKDICFNRLQNLKALRMGEDTKDITASFQRMLDAGKLQPKQNAGDTVSEAQTFGTLIDKWENTRPIPEVDEELKDVDKLGLLTHVFFTGHIAKVLNLPSSLTALYDKFIGKYTVEKQEYSGNSDNEALFNTIFGKKNIDEQDEQIE